MQRLLPIGARFALVVTFALAMGLLCLLVPSRVGSWLVERGMELGRDLQVAGSSERGHLWEMLEDATGGVLMLAPAVGAYVARAVLREPLKWLGLLPDLAAASRSVMEYVVRGSNGRRVPVAFLKPGVYVAVLLFLVGWYGEVLPPMDGKRSVEPVYLVAAGGSGAVLPVQLVVHFENARIDENGELTGWGVSVGDGQREKLRATVEALQNCVAPGRDVRIEPYGFASDDEFRGLGNVHSDELNVRAANLRGSAVYNALVEVADDFDNVMVSGPSSWPDLPTMIQKRNAMVMVPDGRQRNAFADRVGVLFLAESGACRVLQDVSIGTRSEVDANENQSG